MTNPLTFPWDHCCQHARGQSRVYEPFPNGVPAITVFLPPSPGKHLQTRKLGVSICSLLRRPQGPAPNREHTPDLDPVTHWALTPSPEFSRGEHKRHRPLRGSVLLQTQLQTGSLPPAQTLPWPRGVPGGRRAGGGRPRPGSGDEHGAPGRWRRRRL